MKTVGHEKYKNQFLSDIDIECFMIAKKYFQQHGYSPLYNEIACLLGLSKAQVVRSMSNLVEIGFIQYYRDRGRGYLVTKAGELFKVPEAVKTKKFAMYGHYELTDTELEVMRAINTLFVQCGLPPSFSEIVKQVGQGATSNIAYVVNSLRNKGYLKPDSGFHFPNSNQFLKVIERTEKGIRAGQEWSRV